MRIVTNDILYSNYICHVAWFSPEQYSPEKVEQLIAQYNATEVLEDNYMSCNFADTYYSAANCRKIGFIREDIERKFKANEINARERALLVTSLLYAMDKIANTVGHYDAWRKRGNLDEMIVLKAPQPPERSNGQAECFCEDANQLIERIDCDILFLDPPYNSRQYSDAYHLLENVARWEQPKVVGVARKMDRTGIKSDYCTQKAESAFRDLIEKTKAKYILLTYNNMHNKGNGRSNARLGDETIIDALRRKGRTSVFGVSHKAFTTGKSSRDDNIERIFLCECGKPKLVASPLNYTGGKFRILPQLLDAFPSEINTFVDMFCGGCNVGVNIRANAVVLCDSNPQLMSLLSTIREMDDAEFASAIDGIVDSFGLSNSSRFGYGRYGCESSSGLGSFNKAPFSELKKWYGTLADGTREKSIALYALIVYAFNNQMRFNAKGEFNLPVGKRDFNAKMQRKLAAFASALKADNIRLSSMDFRTFDVHSLGPKDLLYADPPYLVTCASYNESGGWTNKDEHDLLAMLDAIHAAGSRFALSNVTESKGKANRILVEWLERNAGRYRAIPIQSDYSNSNYHRKDIGKTTEVQVIKY